MMDLVLSTGCTMKTTRTTDSPVLRDKRVHSGISLPGRA